MIDHTSIPVRDLNTSASFYGRGLAPLGFGKKYPEFWINLRQDMI
ncbi:MAG: lyase, partial [Rhodospirillaceae bacterium]